MIEQLTSMGWGIVMLAIIIVIGSSILIKFGKVSTTCSSLDGGKAVAWNGTCCSNTTNCSPLEDPYQANATAGYLTNQLGQNGLAGYVPLIIIAAIGLGILGWFMAGKGRRV
jgi:hypothetical protein